MTSILLNPLVQDGTGLAAKHGRITAIPTGGSFPQSRAWDLYPYNPATIELDPPAYGTAWNLVLTIGTATTTRTVIFSGASVDWDHLTDVDPTTLEPHPAGPGIPIWDEIKADLLAVVQQHIDADTPHPAYDTDMPDLSLLFENKVLTGAVDSADIPDLTTVFDNTN